MRAGGTCVLCGRYLLEGALTGAEVSLGELAHIVGQQQSKLSPRGDHPMPRESYGFVWLEESRDVDHDELAR